MDHLQNVARYTGMLLFDKCMYNMYNAVTRKGIVFL